MSVTDELIARYQEINRQIRVLETERNSVIDALPKLYVVEAFERGDSPMWAGWHFAAKSPEACVKWLLENYPQMEMVTSHQFDGKGVGYRSLVAGHITHFNPLEPDNWAKASALYAGGQG